jgi:protein gp37
MGQAKYQADGDPRTSGPGFGITTHEDVLEEPLHWRTPRVVFVNSMSDIAHARVGGSFAARIWAVMALTRRHTFQVLTKRPKRLAAMLSDPSFAAKVAWHATGLIASQPWQRWQLDLGGQRLAGDSGLGTGWTTVKTGSATTWIPPWPLPNVWVGTSIENDDYTWRADFLRRAPASTRFLSLEPLLGPLPSLDLTGIDWVIAGGESGPAHRPIDLTWVCDIRDRCIEQNVDFFFKQVGGPTPKSGGRQLDGRTWDQMPSLAGSTRLRPAHPPRRTASPPP